MAQVTVTSSPYAARGRWDQASWWLLWVLTAAGLGSKPSTCHIVSGVINKGDGLTICDTDDVNLAIAQLKNNTGHIYEV
eukprot:gene7533-7743_t